MNVLVEAADKQCNLLLYLIEKSSEKQFNSNSFERILEQDMKSLLSPPRKKQRL